jgi:hypothetical protein
LVGC